MSDGEFWQQRRVLVTGAKGFVAAHLIKHLLQAGAQVVGLERDIHRIGYFDSEELGEAIELVEGDLSDYDLMESMVARYDVQTIIHLAAQALVAMANEDPLPTFDTNIRGTYVVLEVARRGWEQGHGSVDGVVVASSDKAYGAQEQLPYTEDAPLRAEHPYDVSKACGDMLARTYAHTYGLPVAVVRCANIYGPGDLNFSRLIPHTIRTVLEGQRPQIRSDGTPQRDYLFIDDAVRGYLLVAEQLNRPQVSGQAFNLGTGEPVSVLELVEQIIHIVGDREITPQILAESWGEIDQQYLDASKAKKILGWEPRVEHSEGLRVTVEWYRRYQQGLPAAQSSTN